MSTIEENLTVVANWCRKLHITLPVGLGFVINDYFQIPDWYIKVIPFLTSNSSAIKNDPNVQINHDTGKIQ